MVLAWVAFEGVLLPSCQSTIPGVSGLPVSLQIMLWFVSLFFVLKKSKFLSGLYRK